MYSAIDFGNGYRFWAREETLVKALADAAHEKLLGMVPQEASERNMALDACAHRLHANESIVRA